jgi:hypothetical protein
MPLDFPNTPTDGQIFNAAGVSWMWDGTKWTSVLSAGGPFLPLAGGDMTGPLNYTATGATTKRSAQDRAADVINVQDYGQIGTGDANIDTATVLAAVAALPTNGGVLRIGSRNIQGITLNQTITITKSCKIEGVTSNGWCSSIICQMSGPAILFSDPTPSNQLTFEVENIRFVANNATGPTAAAIRVSVGPTTSQVFPTFVARNLTMIANVTTAAAPYARTFTTGMELAPASNPGTGGVHNFWNIVLEDITLHGVNDSGTGNPIAGTAGFLFGHLIYASLRNVNISSMASGLRQTAYCEGITCVSCQLFSCTNGWDQSAFAPTGVGAVKLNQGVMLGCMINAWQSAIALDCVYISQFAHNYFTGAGANNVALTNAQGSMISNNNLVNGTTGISMTRAGFNEGGNVIQGNNFANQTTHISLGANTFDTVIDNQQQNGSPAVIVNSGGDGNLIRGVNGPLTLGVGSSTNNTEVKLLGASGAWRAMSIWTGTTAGTGQRWAIGTGTTTESGGNAGSDLLLSSFSDSGGSLGTPLVITRATGALQIWNGLGLFGHAPVTARPTVTGSKGANAALASLLTALSAYGLVTDSST